MIASVLTSIKKLVGVDASYDHFDEEIIMDINSALLTLYQLGAGLNDVPLFITDDTTEWSDLFSEDEQLSGVKQFIMLKCRMRFDPPASSTVIKSFETQIQELEWRILAQVEKEGVTIDET